MGESLRETLQIGGYERECLVEIERCTQHIQGNQLRAISKTLDTSYDALIDGIEETE